MRKLGHEFAIKSAASPVGNVIPNESGISLRTNAMASYTTCNTIIMSVMNLAAATRF